MKITEHDWSLATTVTRDYPQEMFEDFINWFLNTKHWEYDVEYVIDKVQRLREQIAHVRIEIVAQERAAAAEKAAKLQQEKDINAEASRLIEAAGV